MKYLVVFLLAMLLSCRSAEDETLLFLNEGVERCNEFLENSTSDYSAMMVAASYENPAYVRPIKEKTDSIELLTNSLIEICEAIQKETISKYDTVKSKQFLLAKQNISHTGLEGALEKYYAYIIRLNKIDSFYYKDEIHQLVEEKTGFNLAEINRLANKIRLINYNTLSFYFKKIECKSYKFSKIIPVVIPEKRYLKYGEEYEARIFITAIDSTTEIMLRTTSMDMLYSENGVIHYQEFVEIPGKYIRGGVIELENPMTRELMQFPLKFEYLIIK